jgi:hypothetical protein
MKTDEKEEAAQLHDDPLLSALIRVKRPFPE